MGDYDFEPTSTRSSFLRLKSKGESVRVRIASKPYREPKVWKADVKAPLDDEKAGALTEEQWARIMGDPDYNVTEVFSWIVIDRADGVAKIFSASPGVYKSIQELAKEDAWGDPKGYDIKITRTEEPGRNYYKVDPLPEKTPLTDRELKLVDNIDMRSQVPNARPLSEKQIDNIDTFMEQNSAPKSNVDVPSPTPPADDVVIEDIGDEPINLDDIPF